MAKRNLGTHNKKDQEEDEDVVSPLGAAGSVDMSDEDEDPMEDDWVAGDDEEDEKDML